MAVQADCRRCGKSFSAQDDYLGKKVKCPNCGERVSVLTDAEREVEAERDRWRLEQEQKISLIETIEQGRQTSTFGGMGIDPVRNFNPGAVSRFRKLRALSGFLILSAYLVTGMSLVTSGLFVFLYATGVITSGVWLAVALIVCLLVLVLTFSSFKFLGELSWLLADIGDHQLDVRNLLLDVRDDFDRIAARETRRDGTPTQ